MKDTKDRTIEVNDLSSKIHKYVELSNFDELELLIKGLMSMTMSTENMSIKEYSRRVGISRVVIAGLHLDIISIKNISLDDLTRILDYHGYEAKVSTKPVE